MSLNPNLEFDADGAPHGAPAPRATGGRPHAALAGSAAHAGSLRDGAIQNGAMQNGSMQKGALVPAQADRNHGAHRRHADAAPADRQAFASPAIPPAIPVQDLPIRIARDGTWSYRGSPIRRRELVCLFSQALSRDADGAYWLITPRERGRIAVDDVPWMAVEMFWSGEGKSQAISFRTNVDEVVTAGRDHRIRLSHDLITCHPTPYVHVRDGLEARIARSVYYELVALSVPERKRGAVLHGVWSCGEFFPVGEIA